MLFDRFRLSQDSQVNAKQSIFYEDKVQHPYEGFLTMELRDQQGNLLDSWTKKNVITKDASILVARLMKDPAEPIHGCFALAVGTGDTGWNPMNPPAATNTQRSLYQEISRKVFSTTTFVDSLGAPTALKTNVVDFTATFSESEGVGPLVEMGIIGGRAVLTPRNPILPPNGTYNDTVDVTSKDILVNYLTFPVINKPGFSTLTFTWRLTF